MRRGDDDYQDHNDRGSRREKMLKFDKKHSIARALDRSLKVETYRSNTPTLSVINRFKVPE